MASMSGLVFTHEFFEHVNSYKKNDTNEDSKVLLVIIRLYKYSFFVFVLKIIEKFFSTLLSLKLPIYRDLVLMFVTYLPGLPRMFGCYLRSLYYRGVLKKMGSNIIIEEGVHIYHPEAVELSDFCFLDKNVILAARTAFIGKRVHLAPNVVITGGGDFIIEDYACIATGSKVITSTETLRDGSRSSGPMVPLEQRDVLRGKVVIKKDAFIAVNVVLLTNTIIEEGSVILPNIVMGGTSDKWTFYKNRIKPEKLSRLRKTLDS